MGIKMYGLCRSREGVGTYRLREFRQIFFSSGCQDLCVVYLGCM